MRPRDVELVLDAQATLGEGPVWDDRRGLLWWVDIEQRLVHRWSPTDGPLEPLGTPGRVGAVALRSDGALLLALQDGFWLAEPLQMAAPRAWVRLAGANPSWRLNDAKCDPQGNLWAGSMRLDAAEGGGRLYRLAPDGSVQVMLERLTISNGMAWRSDGRMMYHVDTPTGRIDAFDFDPQAGTISNRRMAVDLSTEDGSPDGMTIDSDDHLWVAMWGGSAVLRCRPGGAEERGEVIERIAMPVRQPTSCAFGGESLQDLYVTSADKDLPPDAGGPQGGLFRIRVDVPGRPPDRFG
jgi:sugar lactone lactonase YvrE